MFFLTSHKETNHHVKSRLPPINLYRFIRFRLHARGTFLMYEFLDGFATYYEFEIDVLINLDSPSHENHSFHTRSIFFKYESRMT